MIGKAGVLEVLVGRCVMPLFFFFGGSVGRILQN